MRNLLAFAATALVAFLAVGYYLDWYKIRPVPTETGHRSYTIDIDAKKITHDSERGVHKVEEKVQDLLDKNPTESVKKSAEKKTSNAVDTLKKDAARFLGGETEEAETKQR